MTLYCGIDLHANNSVLAILDEHDQVHFEKRLPNDLGILVGALEPFREALAGCVVESTYNWYWLVDGLMEAGFRVHLAHTGGIVQYAGLKHTNDESDARHLAHLLRLGILAEGYIMPKEPRALRDLLRRRMLLVHQRTLNLLSLQSLITRHTGERLSANQIKTLDVDTYRDRLPEPIVVGALVTAQSMRVLDHLIDLLEQDVHRRLHDQEDFRLLTTIPGVGKILGATIALETGTIKRFPGPGQYASYARCTNTQKISNGKTKGRGNKKNGNKYLAWAFMEAAHHAAIWSPRIKQFYHKRRAKRHILVAKKTVANKLARACYHMLSKQEAFDVTRAFG
ncbi:IS110 family RNA-guided transposase [Thiorhodovibrio litoralis]|uniref:IS110 family transposase n=1 Tax=Thiorhodovibrio litoralis TaxID=2952932 RepID=UPI002B25894C|nr:IS110 family transposase [Thiorhodovibrio litoralis]WPL13537.1 Transposase IS116/IS110/IS902 family protein [Thiorhodovibrio litoralis]